MDYRHRHQRPIFALYTAHFCLTSAEPPHMEWFDGREPEKSVRSSRLGFTTFYFLVFSS